MGHEQARSSLFELRHRTPDGRSRGAARTDVRAARLPSMSDPRGSLMRRPPARGSVEMVLLHAIDFSVTLYHAHSLVSVLPSFVHVLSIHCLTPTHEATDEILLLHTKTS